MAEFEIFFWKATFSVLKSSIKKKFNVYFLKGLLNFFCGLLKFLKKSNFFCRHTFYNADPLYLLSHGVVGCHTKFGPDRFCSKNVYWIQTGRETDKQSIYIDKPVITSFSCRVTFFPQNEFTLLPPSNPVHSTDFSP